MKSYRLAVVLVALMASMVVSRLGYTAESAPLMVPLSSDPAACHAEQRQQKECTRWYALVEKESPDACSAARLSGEKCGRWYSVGYVAAAPTEEVIVLRGINFDTAKADIKPESIPILERNVDNLKKKRNSQIVIEGHTDSRGSAAYNQKLSEQRANSVLNWFAANGIDRERMTAVGKGEDYPVADNTTQEGMYQNRRIELRIR